MQSRKKKEKEEEKMKERKKRMRKFCNCKIESDVKIEKNLTQILSLSLFFPIFSSVCENTNHNGMKFSWIQRLKKDGDKRELKQTEKEEEEIKGEREFQKKTRG